MARVNRRTFLRVAGVHLGAAAAALPARPARVAARRRAQSSPDVAVVGGGAFGGWAALHLREAGSR